jgi:hypothetical protein
VISCVGSVEERLASIAGHDKWLGGKVADRYPAKPGELRTGRQDCAEFIAHNRNGLHAGGGKLYQRHIDHLGAKPLLKQLRTLARLIEQHYFDIGMGLCEAGDDLRIGKGLAWYPIDVTDDEWAFVAAYLALCREDAPQRSYSLRAVFNALRYIVKSGMQW